MLVLDTYDLVQYDFSSLPLLVLSKESTCKTSCELLIKIERSCLNNRSESNEILEKDLQGKPGG